MSVNKPDPRAAPLLLLPGLLCDDGIWAHQVAALAQYSPVAVPGFPGARSIRAMAEQSLALAPPLFSLVGHSMGARVALEVAALAPDRVERLALLDTGVHPPTAAEAAKRRALLAIARRDGIEAMVDLWLPPMVHPDRRGDAAFMAPLRAMAAAGGVGRYAAQVEALLGRPDPRPFLPTIRCPVLVGAGREDEWSPADQNRAIAAAIPGADFALFDHCGHMAPVEAPDQVTLALRRWLERPQPRFRPATRPRD